MVSPAINMVMDTMITVIMVDKETMEIMGVMEGKDPTANKLE